MHTIAITSEVKIFAGKKRVSFADIHLLMMNVNLVLFAVIK